jgi:hypothetical protein
VYGYTKSYSPLYKVFVNKISPNLGQISGFPIVINEDDNRYYGSDAKIDGEIIHMTGRAWNSVVGRENLFHMGINLEDEELTYLSFVDLGVNKKCGGSTVLPLQNGVLVGGACYNASYSDYFLSFLDLSSATVTQEITLNAGWNTISIRVEPGDMAIEAVFGSAFPYCEKILTKENGVWEVYYQPDPFFNTLSEIKPRQSYLVKMTSDATFSVTGIPVSVDEAQHLNSGIVMPGYLSGEVIPVAEALFSIYDQCVKVLTIENGDWKVFYRDDPLFNTLLETIPGQGYIMRIDSEVDWVLPK